MLEELLKLFWKVIITFLLTNIQDVVILINFFLESAKPNSELTNTDVVLGQYLGYSTLLSLSLIGFAISYILPVKLFGFLGFLIIFFGLNGLYQLVKNLRGKRKQKTEVNKDEKQNIINETEAEPIRVEPEDQLATTEKKPTISLCERLRRMCKVSIVTIANGNDNIAIYVPIFVQSKPWEILVYVVGFLLMVAVLCSICYCFIHFPPVFKFAQKYAQFISPFIFIALGIYILIDSECFPWLIKIIRTGQWSYS